MKLKTNTIYRMKNGNEVGPLVQRAASADWELPDGVLDTSDFDGYMPMWGNDGSVQFFFDQKDNDAEDQYRIVEAVREA